MLNAGLMSTEAVVVDVSKLCRSKPRVRTPVVTGLPGLGAPVVTGQSWLVPRVRAELRGEAMGGSAIFDSLALIKFGSLYNSTAIKLNTTQHWLFTN